MKIHLLGTYRARRAAEVAAVTFLAGAFALANGMTVYAGNQRQYLLHGLHAADPKLWASDWFVSQTTAYHGLFGLLIRALAPLGSFEALLGLANGACTALFAVGLYLLVRRVSRHAIAAFALLLLLISFNPNPGLGWSAWLSAYFQPSSVGSLGFVLGLAALAYERYAWAGLFFAVGGLFHANFLVLSFPLLGVAAMYAARGRDRRDRIAIILCLLGPVLAAMAAHFPYLLAMRDDVSSASVARSILFDTYIPQHYRPASWPPESFMRFACALLLAWVAGRKLCINRVVRAVLLTAVAMVMFGLVLTSFLSIDVVSQLNPFRLAPLAPLAALACGAAQWTRLATDLRIPIARAATLAALIAIGMLGVGVSPTGVAYAVAMTLPLWVARLRWQPAGITRPWGGRHVLHAVAPVACSIVVMGLLLLRMGLVRKDLLHARVRPAEAELFAWCRTDTRHDAVFVIPPHMSEFRLMTHRSVVADWKCFPLLPHEQLEWQRRLVALAGRPFCNEPDAEVGYNELDADRADWIVQQFGADYAVTLRHEHRGDLTGLPAVFENEKYRVVSLRPREFCAPAPQLMSSAAPRPDR